MHPDSLPDFRKTMIELGNTLRDHTKSIAYLELFRLTPRHTVLCKCLQLTHQGGRLLG